jgi:hypothetical protein
VDLRSYPVSKIVRFVTVIATALVPLAYVFADDPRVEIRLPDNSSGMMGELVTIPVYLDYLADTLDGYMVSISLTRDDILYFEVDTVVAGEDTSFVCEFDTSGTLSSGWQYIAARSLAHRGLDVRVTGVSDVATGTGPGIAPASSGVLVRIFGRIKRNLPDSLVGKVVGLDIADIASFYSNEAGQLILPALNTDGQVTLDAGMPGDMNCDGDINPIDCVYLINYVYKNWDVLCNNAAADLNCDVQINPVDVVLIINSVYKNWPVPPC